MTSAFPFATLAIMVMIYVFTSMFSGEGITAPFDDIEAPTNPLTLILFIGDIIVSLFEALFRFLIFDTGFDIPTWFQLLLVVFLDGSLLWSIIELVWL